MTMLSPAGITSWLVFPRQHLVLQPKVSVVRVRLASKMSLSTRIVPEPALLCLKWKIQLEENTTSHSPEHVGWRCRRARFSKLAGNFRQTGSYHPASFALGSRKGDDIRQHAIGVRVRQTVCGILIY